MSENTEKAIGTLVAIAIVVAFWVGKSWIEATAYNHATGSHVSTWDAMFVKLRVTPTK